MTTVDQQKSMFRMSDEKYARLNEAFMDMINDPVNPMTREDLEALISRRPDTYGRFAGFLDSLPSAQPLVDNPVNNHSLTVSLDGGETWVVARNGVRVISDDNVSYEIILYNITHEGIITDIIDREAGEVFGTECTEHGDIMKRLLDEASRQNLFRTMD